MIYYNNITVPQTQNLIQMVYLVVNILPQHVKSFFSQPENKLSGDETSDTKHFHRKE